MQRSLNQDGIAAVFSFELRGPQLSTRYAGDPAKTPIKILATSDAGFIGSAIIRHTGDSVVNVRKLTSAGNPESPAEVSASGPDRLRPLKPCTNT